MTIANTSSFNRLITINNAKTVKGEKLNYLTGIMYLAPAHESGVINVCPKASPGCRAMCLFTAGRGAMGIVRRGRIARTLAYKADPQAFADRLIIEVGALIKSAERVNLTPAVRINGTSDLPKLALTVAEAFPNVQFYDYTKIPKPWLRIRPNYDLTFSRSETNEAECIEALKNGINVAVVFSTRPKETLPSEYLGHEVISGDLHDLRFLDKKGVIVGLTAKGKARRDTSGFVVQV